MTNEKARSLRAFSGSAPLSLSEARSSFSHADDEVGTSIRLAPVKVKAGRAGQANRGRPRRLPKSVRVVVRCPCPSTAGRGVAPLGGGGFGKYVRTLPDGSEWSNFLFPMERRVVLTEQLDLLAKLITASREVAAQIVGRTPAHGAPPLGSKEGYETSLAGVRAEVAFWEATHREARINAVILVPYLNQIKGDATWRGETMEIRSTDYVENGHLIVHPDNDPGHYYVLCLRHHPVYEFPGYLIGHRAQDVDKYLLDPDPRGERNFWVPQRALDRWRGH